MQENFRLTEEQVEFFNENGYVHLKGALAPWELEWLDRASMAIINHAIEGGPINEDFLFKLDPATGKQVLHRINKMYLKSPDFFAAWAQPTVLGAEASLYGPNVLPGDDALVVKMPDYGVLVPWHGAQHRDNGKAHVRPPVINAGFYLDSATAESGCLYVIPGSFRWEGLDPQEFHDKHGFWLPGAVPVPAEAGDVILHREDLWHGSPTTRGGGFRRVFYVAYNTAEKMLESGQAVSRLRNRLGVFLRAMETRANLTKDVGERPYAFRPTLPELQVNLDEIGYVELRATR